jgi:methionyl-tRNA formyltransferase
MEGPRVTAPHSLRVALYGDGRWAADALRRIARGPHRTVGIVGRRHPSDRTLADAARELNLQVARPDRINAAESVALLTRWAPDVAVSVAYDQILGPAAIRVPPLGTVNLHAGFLPQYRGRNVISWALLNGETEIGITLHYMDEGIDTGDIILQRKLPIEWTDDYGRVLDRVVAACPGLVAEGLDLIAAGIAPRRPQSPEAATYFGGRSEGDEWLDWNDSSLNLYNKIRAITRPGPGARTVLGSDRVIVWRATYDPARPRYVANAGQVVGRHADGVVVKTGDSTICLREVQVGDGEPMVPDWPLGTRVGLNMLDLLHRVALSAATMGVLP